MEETTTTGYVVIEIQTFEGGAVTTQAWHYADRLGAEAKFHSVLAAAAKSALPLHAAALLGDDGFPYAHESYEHGEVE